MESLLKNIHEFVLSIYLPAKSRSGWDKKNIERAFSWAQYCEDITKKCHGRAFEQQLELCLSHLAEKTTCRHLYSLRFLSHAKKELTESFLQNTTIPLDLLQQCTDVLSIVQECDIEFERTSSVKNNQIFHELLELSKVIDEQYSGLDVGMETQAHLMAALLTSNPDCLKDNKTLTRLNDIALQPNGMQLIFALTRIADSRVLEVITAWFREYLQELDASKVKSIVTLPPAMKQSAFASFSGMFDVWTAFLSQEGKCQNPEYVNEEIQWRCGFPGFLSTEQLINEWKLLMAKKDTKERTQALLRDLRSQEGCSFWDFLECAREHTIHSSVEVCS